MTVIVRRGAAFWVVAAASLASAQTTKPASFDAFGRELEAAVGARDADAFNGLVDVDAFCKRIFRGINSPGRRDLETGVRSTFRQTMAGFVGQLPPDGHVTFLRHRVVDGEDRVTLRLTGPLGLNYWDCVAEPIGPGGALRIADIHIAISGEPFSQSVQRILLRLAPANGKTLTAAELQQTRDMQAYVKVARDGDGREALKQFDALPAGLRREKTFQLLRVIAATRVADEPALLDAAADEFKRRFGDDPACDLTLIDTYLNRKQFVEAMACVDRLDANVGGDPFLDVMRSNVRLFAKDLPEAKRFATRAREREKSLFAAADSLLTIALRQSDFAEARRMLLLIEATPAYRMRFADDLNDAEVFAAFKASPEYARWLTERPKQNAASQPVK